MRITPAILESDFNSVSEKIDIATTFAKQVHIDVCDGGYVSARSWPLQTQKEDIFFRELVEQKKALPSWESMDFEVHLMVRQPEMYAEDFIQAGFSRIIAHPDASQDFSKVIEITKGRVELFAALQLSVSDKVLESIAEDIQGVLLMGIEHIGQQGQEFKNEVLERAKNLKEKYPHLQIVIDGGVNENTIMQIKETGADRAVIGSAIFKNVSPMGSYRHLAKLVA